MELYKNIKHSTNNYNKGIHNINRIILSKNGYNPTKKIFNELKSKLRGDSIIYIFSWHNNTLRPKQNDFKALVFDKLSGVNYYINIENGNLSFKENSEKFNEEIKILKEYNIDDSLLSIKESQNLFSSSELGTNYYIFDLKNRNVIFLESIVFDNNGDLFLFFINNVEIKNEQETIFLK